MNNFIFLELHNGLGDKFSDLIGLYIICKHLNYKPNVSFCIDCHHVGIPNYYDMRLFDFHNSIIINNNNNNNNNNNCSYYIKSYPSLALCPPRVYEYLKKFKSEITYQQISQEYIDYAKEIIKPSSIILDAIPEGINNAYGIHLRASDQLNEDLKETCLGKTSSKQFENTKNKILDDVREIIKNEENPSFFVISEVFQWRDYVKDKIREIAIEYNKNINLINLDYNNNYHNYNSVLEFFCLSKCKEIFQGSNYSTFSMIASILGTQKLRNYSIHFNNNEKCILNAWTSVIDFNNNEKQFDIDNHLNHIKCGQYIESNITKIFE